MNKINLCDYFTELYERPLKVVTNGKGCTIQATDRNTLKQEIMATFKEFLAQQGVECYQTNEGIIIAVQNRAVEDENEEGVISIELGMKIKNLDYCPAFEESDFLEVQKEKAEKKAKAEEAKKEKMERDRKARAEAKALKALRE